MEQLVSLSRRDPIQYMGHALAWPHAWPHTWPHTWPPAFPCLRPLQPRLLHPILRHPALPRPPLPDSSMNSCLPPLPAPRSQLPAPSVTSMPFWNRVHNTQPPA